jgi:hypothetical protein
MERLEGRQMLTLTVNTSIDEVDGSITDGDISLRDAIAAASPGETINFAATLNGQTITLTRVGIGFGQVSFSKSLTIDASALGNGLTIDGNDPTPGQNGDGIRIFDVADTTQGANPPLVILRGLTLTKADVAGLTPQGGAIRSAARLIVRNCTIVNNRAAIGAGIFVEVAGGGPTTNREVLRIENSTIEDNHASGSGGGGVAVVSGNSLAPTSDTILINGATVISGNTADAGDGGGVHVNLYGADLTIEDNSIFAANEASGSGGGLFAAIHDNSNLVINGSSFDLNVADAPFFGGGGAIFTQMSPDADAVFDIVDSEITGNLADSGGGVYVRMPGFSHTSAIDSVLTIQRTVIESNSAVNRGGGILMAVGSGGRAKIEDSTITGNNAGLELLGSQTAINNSGGGLYAYLFSYDYAGLEPSRLTISGTTIDNNVAGQHGGGIAVCSKRGTEDPVTDESGSQLFIANSTISGNQAGHTTVLPVAGTGGGIHIAVPEVFEPEAINVDIHNATIYNNIADQGGGIYSYTFRYYDGTETNVSLKNTIISGNKDYATPTPNANNFWGSINASETRYSLVSYDPNAIVPDNYFLDHASQMAIPFTGPNGLDPSNLDNGGTNDPGLTPLGNFGGLTMTHELFASSPAIDAGSNDLAVDPVSGLMLDYDQRGSRFPRKADDDGGPPDPVVDIGAIETSAPRVVSVSIGSSITALDPDPVFPVPDSGEQIRTVPIARPNQLVVRFSKNVTVPSTAPYGLSISGLRYPTRVYTVLNAQTAGNVVTWTFMHGTPSNPQTADISDQLEFNIDDTVTDDGGTALDGEWTSPTMLGVGGSLFPSGDEVQAGDFSFHVTVFPGDFTLNNMVDGSDFGVWNSHKFTNDCEFEHGDANGDCVVDGSDFALWNQNKFMDWTGLGSRPIDLEELRRVIDLLIAQFGVLDQNGVVNQSASIATWQAFAAAIENVFEKFEQPGTSPRPMVNGGLDPDDTTCMGGIASSWSPSSLGGDDDELGVV